MGIEFARVRLRLFFCFRWRFAATEHGWRLGMVGNGRGGVCGEISVGIGNELDVDVGFDEQFDEVIGKNGRGDAYACDAAAQPLFEQGDKLLYLL